MLLFLVLSSLLFASTVQCDSVPYTLCSSTDKYHYTISSLTAVSWPPVAGKSVNVTANGTLDETVTGGTYAAKATYEGFPLGSESGEISSMKPVPWAAGVFSFDYVFPIPSAAPSGKYTATLSAVDQNKSTLFCINLAFSIKGEEEKVEGEKADWVRQIRRGKLGSLKKMIGK